MKTPHRNPFLRALFARLNPITKNDRKGYEITIRELPELLSQYARSKSDLPSYPLGIPETWRQDISVELLIKLSDSIFQTEKVSDVLQDFLQTFNQHFTEGICTRFNAGKPPTWHINLGLCAREFFIRMTKIVPVLIMMVSTLIRDFRGEEEFSEVSKESLQFMRTFWYHILERKYKYSWAVELRNISHERANFQKKFRKIDCILKQKSTSLSMGWKIATLWLSLKRPKAWGFMCAILARSPNLFVEDKIHQQITEILLKTLYFSDSAFKIPPPKLVLKME